MKMMLATVAFELVERKTLQGVFAIKRKTNECVMSVHGIVWVFGPASLKKKDAQITEVRLPEHAEERTRSASVTLQPFALLCKISKWMSA